MSSEHRVSTREASTAYAAEDGGVRLKTRPRECWLGMQEHAFRFKSEYGGVRVLSSAGWDASRDAGRHGETRGDTGRYRKATGHTRAHTLYSISLVGVQYTKAIVTPSVFFYSRTGETI